ncbi:glycosyltransferase family 4 protein [Pedobacter duraquae]|uniref:Phosphatidylinositol alpha-1,6-mannosyltransferase n=1 Tax=Pedobacter duraquae TaxID=425511 RepID=A0A4R6II75_9SPHI|nr:glycosyltransferase family 4 protein [Pedobacter duraquae]TDO21650.1 phosphatidylinositol alpha-1,6-mannosyltransferase [Pedobacter duraquae]
MEILFISHKYPPVIGGMEKQSFELITGMKKHAKVYSIILDAEKESRLHFFLNLEDRIIAMCIKHPLITIIHFNDALVAAACLRHKRYRHLKHTMTVHGLDVVFPNWIYRTWIFKKFNRFSLIFAVSTATAQACIARGINKDKIVVVHNGVDHAMQAPACKAQMETLLSSQYGIDTQGQRVIVAMGRPVTRKGFSWFIAQVVPKLDPDIMLLLIGPGQQTHPVKSGLWSAIPETLRKPIELFLGMPSDARQITKLVNKPNTAAVVKQLGAMAYEDILKIMRSADAFVMPNIAIKGDMEGFGLVCLEAALCGVPVYAAAIDGITDVIHNGKNGFLLPSGDAEIWARHINAIGTNSAAAFLREEAMAYTAAQFGWTKMVQEYEYHFSTICPA